MKLVNKKSSVISEGKPKLPTSDQLVYGEIAVNYADSYEALAIKNSSNNIVTFITSSQTNNLINNAISSALTNIEGTDIIVGDDITVSGITFVHSGDTLYSGLSSLVQVIVDDEETTAKALLELHDDIAAISGSASGIPQLQSAITAEVSRATAAEGTLSGSIVFVSSSLTQEVNRAIEVEGGLSNRIGDVVSFASGISSDLSDEITRASGAEATLSGRIDTLSGRVDNALTVISVNSTTLNTGNTAVTLDSSNINAVSAISYSGETIVASGDSIQSAMTKIVNSVFEKLGEANVEIVSTTPSSTNVREEWKLVDSAGTQHGDSIKIYKDSSLIYPYLGHVDDTLVSSASTAVTSGSGDTALCFIYQKADGSYELVAVNVESFLEESEFGNGLDVTNHVVSVKKDSTSEEYLTVSSNGVKVSGIKDKLDNALSSATINGETLNSGNTTITLDGNDISVGSSVTRSGITVIESSDTVYQGFSAMMTIIATNEEVTANALLELRDDVNLISGSTSGISNLESAITAEVTRATNAENTLSGRIDGVTGNIQTLSATVSGLSSEISGEVTRATGAEAALSGRIDTVTDNVQTLSGVVSGLSSDISSEVTRATTAENTLSGRIDTVTGNVSTLSGVVSGLSSDLAGEIARATAAEAILSGMIESSLTELSVNGNVLNSGNTAVTLNGEDILVGGDVVKSGRTVISSADTVHSGFTILLNAMADNEEVTANALLELHDDIDAISGSVSGISNIQSAVNTISGNLNTLSGVVSGVNSALTQEISRATTAEGALGTRIDGVTGNVQTLSGLVSGLSSDLSGEVTRATNAEDVLSGRIDTLSATMGNALTAISVNSTTLNTGNTAVTINANSISAVSAISHDGNTIVASGDSVQSAMSEIVETLYTELGSIGDELSALTIVSATPSTTNVREEWKLVDSAGTQHGSSIKIYKDSSLITPYLGHVDDTLVSSASTAVTSGSGDTALCFIYQTADGGYALVSVNVESFLEESEFSDGLDVTNHVVKVKKDSTSEEYLTISSNGVKISGIKDKLDKSLSSFTINNKTVNSGNTTVELNGSDVKIGSAITHSGSTIINTGDTLYQAFSAIESALTGEETRATNAEGTLSGRIDTVTGNVSTLSGAVGDLSDEVSDLSDTISDALTELSINGTTLDTGNTAMTLEAVDVIMGSAVTHSGATIVASGRTVVEGMNDIVDMIVTDERVIAASILDLNNRLCAATSAITDVSDSVSAVSADLHTLSGVVESMSGGTGPTDVDSTDIEMGSAITVSGVTVATSGDTVYDGMKNIFTEMLNNEKTVSTSLLDLDARITEISGSTSPNALTRVSVNGVTASTANTAITVNATQTNLGSAVTVCGVTYAQSSSTVHQGLVAIASAMVEDERVMSEALIDLHNDFNTVSGLPSKVTTLSGNVSTLSGNVNTISGNVNTLSGNVSTISAATQNVVTSLTITTIVSMTQTQYDNLQTKDPTTLYVITGGAS